jgi:two-component system, OmpR family, phosphate regulon response regulator PhoB
MRLTVLIVEDDPAVRELLRFSFDAAGFSVQQAASTDEAKRLLASVRPDAVILDWMLPGESGLAFLKWLRGDVALREMPVLMLTARGEETDRIAGLDYGADDYVTKPFSPKELIARIRAVLRRRAPQAAGEAVEMMSVRLEPTNYLATFKGKRIDMGPVEFRLLHFFMSNPNRVFDRDQILNTVWGHDSYVQDRTVDVYIRRVRATLEDAGAPPLIETVRGVGYRVIEES